MLKILKIIKFAKKKRKKNIRPDSFQVIKIKDNSRDFCFKSCQFLIFPLLKVFGN